MVGGRGDVTICSFLGTAGILPDRRFGEGMDLRQRGLALGGALLLAVPCATLGGVVLAGHAWASSSATAVKRPHPSPTPSPSPTTTPRPTPTPTPTPRPTPTPTPPPTPTATPRPTPTPATSPTRAPTATPSAAPIPSLIAGAPPAEGSAQAVEIAPTPQAPSAVDVATPADTPDLFLMLTVAMLALPLLLVMTLLATVLTRR